MLYYSSMIQRRKTRRVNVGSVPIGDGAPIAVQSMTKTFTENVDATLKQIEELFSAGCQIIRVAVPDRNASRALKRIVAGSPIPIVADIHFNHILAVEAVENGVAGLRINPGNIREPEKVEEIVTHAKEAQIPIRVGVNSGSVDPEFTRKYPDDPAKVLVESAMRHVGILEDLDFHDIKISVKSTDVPTTYNAYKMISNMVDYPLHLGVTEAGTLLSGSIKSAAGIGALLMGGIGDTIRVSLTADPVEEIVAAKKILQTIGYEKGPEVVSCPTCGRCQIDLLSLAENVEKRLFELNLPVSVAVMGCIVNGPGEAKEADFGIAGEKDSGIVFSMGKKIKKVPYDSLIDELFSEIARKMGRKVAGF